MVLILVHLVDFSGFKDEFAKNLEAQIKNSIIAILIEITRQKKF
jgi:hypothetical protein